MKKVNLSVVVLAKNEEKNIVDCLKSVAWADERIVIDNGSDDQTVFLAKKQKTIVFSWPIGSYKDLRNAGLKHASGNWLFYLDADERVTPSLRDEIIQLTNLSTAKSSLRVKELNNFAYAIPRENVILGKVMRHGGWYPDYVKRLFWKKKLKGWKGELHEEPIFEGKLGFLTHPLVHLKHNNLYEMAVKTNKWSDTEARLLFEAHHPPMVPWRFFRVMLTEWFDRLVVKCGFLDMGEGTIYATYQAFSKFVTYAKLWEKQISKKL